MNFLKTGGLIAIVGLAACAPGPQRPTYSPPEESGLIGVRPYPGTGDVCMVIGENGLTSQYLDHTEILIGCPTHEVGAIQDRLTSGGKRLETIGDWLLISVPV